MMLVEPDQKPTLEGRFLISSSNIVVTLASQHWFYGMKNSQ